MPTLPPAKTPLNQHSLVALEHWLMSLGAEKNRDNPCSWNWVMPEWSAQITLKQDELTICWEEGITSSRLSFPYGLSRYDVESVLKHGP